MSDIAHIYSIFKKCTGVSTDSRNISPEVMFVALKGPSFNGNEYADKALESGASYVVVDEKEYKKDDRYILVDNGLKTLQSLANYHRHQISTPMLGITGSNGKTTTKELVTAVLSTHKNIHFTQGNLNNHIGVPLTLLQLNATHEFAIIEMGANKVGDIEELCSIAEPDYGLITNIGKAHLEGFGGIAGVKKGKGEMYQHVKEREGILFVNTDSEDLIDLAGDYEKRVEYGKAESPLKVSRGYHSDLLCYLDESTGQVHQTGMVGDYNINNIRAAYAIGKYFSIPEEDIHRAIKSYLPDNNRSQYMVKNGVEVYLDAYNANPTSMEASLRNFSLQHGSDGVVILGDMLEMGEYAKEEHSRVADICLEMGFEKALLCGEEFYKLKKEYGEYNFAFFRDRRELEGYLSENKLSEVSNFLLIKGSRSIGLEKVLDLIS